MPSTQETAHSAPASPVRSRAGQSKGSQAALPRQQRAQADHSVEHEATPLGQQRMTSDHPAVEGRNAHHDKEGATRAQAARPVAATAGGRREDDLGGVASSRDHVVHPPALTPLPSHQRLPSPPPQPLLQQPAPQPSVRRQVSKASSSPDMLLPPHLASATEVKPGGDRQPPTQVTARAVRKRSTSPSGAQPQPKPSSDPSLLPRLPAAAAAGKDLTSVHPARSEAAAGDARDLATVAEREPTQLMSAARGVRGSARESQGMWGGAEEPRGVTGSGAGQLLTAAPNDAPQRMQRGPRESQDGPHEPDNRPRVARVGSAAAAAVIGNTLQVNRWPWELTCCIE